MTSKKSRSRSTSPWRERTASENAAWVRANARWQSKVNLVKENSAAELDLSWCALGTEGANAFAAAMRYNDKLTSLKLECNALGPEGGRLVIQACQKHEVTLLRIGKVSELPSLDTRLCDRSPWVAMGCCLRVQHGWASWSHRMLSSHAFMLGATISVQVVGKPWGRRPAPLQPPSLHDGRLSDA